MNDTNHKHYYWWIILLYCLLIVERFYGIWFLRWAFDEEQNFGGGTAILKWGFNLFGANIPNPEMEHLVSIYGIMGKYLAVLPAAMGFALEKILPIDLPIPLGLIFTRMIVSFLPSVLTIVLIHKIIRLVSDSRVFLFSALILFLFTFKHIETAHYGVSDALSTFFVVLSGYCFLQFSLVLETKKRNRYLIWTSIACVLCVSTKINVGVVITGVIGLFLLFERGGTETQILLEDELDTKAKRKNIERRDAEAGSFLEDEHRRDMKAQSKGSQNFANDFQLWQQLKRNKHLVVFASTFLLTFLIVNLPYLLNFEEWYGELIRHIDEYPYTIKGTWFTFFYFHPPFGVGWGVLLLAFGGNILWLTTIRKKGDGVAQRKIAARILSPALFFLVLFYLYLVFSRGVIHRWAIPMTPFLVLFAAYFVSNTYSWFLSFAPKVEAGLISILLALFFVLIGFKPLYHVLQLNLALTSTSTTYQSLQEFVDQSISPNTCIYNVEGIELKHCSEEAPKNITALKVSSIEYIVFSDFWFSERRYPASVLYLDVIEERTHGDWRTMRNHIEGEESGWKLEKVVQPKYYSYWSTNIAQPPVFYVYKRVSD